MIIKKDTARMPTSPPKDYSALRTIAQEVIQTEIDGLAALLEMLGGTGASAFDKALDLLLTAKGRIIISGMGKSGHIARKIAATFSSTGTPAIYVHPAEASHGDLGVITNDDVVVALSKSGETAELGDLISYTSRFNIPIIAITEGQNSALSKAATLCLFTPNAPEACPHTPAPTTSTMVMMAYGDALAISLMRAKGVSTSDFHGFHPGGQLGANLRRADDLMASKIDHPLPLCIETASIGQAIEVLSSGGFGCVGLVTSTGALSGILTDGDVRRLFGQHPPDSPVQAVMTRSAKTISPETLAADALRLMNEGKITSLFVISDTKPVGLLHIHHLLAAGVV